jgi:hypothetical protein
MTAFGIQIDYGIYRSKTENVLDTSDACNDSFSLKNRQAQA